MNPNGAILYQGPSILDGAPIVAIATGLRRPSTNTKTGAMVQTWILRADIDPAAALGTSAEYSICGDCKHSGPAATRTCYVQVARAPRAVYHAWRAGRYAAADPASVGAGRRIRIGSYGDPAAVPTHVWRALASGATGRAGYTHQWGGAGAGLRGLVMASVDTLAEHSAARAAGWQTFRTQQTGQRMPDEAICPASAESGHATTCDVCMQCDGAGRRGITIKIHGDSRVMKNAARLIATDRTVTV